MTDLAPPPTSPAEGMAALADRLGDAPAITCGDQQRTWRELESRTNRLARDYEARGVTRDSFVTIGLPNGIEFLEAAVATWKAGATPQPVSDRLPASERIAIIELADPSLLVGVHPDEAGGRPAVGRGHEPDPSVSDAPLDPRIANSVKAPTSGGSTGRPKLIVAGQRATLADIAVHQLYSGMPVDGVTLSTGPLHHNGPFIYGFGALFSGNHVVVMERFDAEEALRLIERHRVRWMYAVPTMMSRIWRLPEEVRTGYDLSSLDMVLHMAAPCPPWLKRAWIDWLGAERVLELYGGTEGQLATIIDGTQWLAHPGSVGRPLVGEIEIRDTDGRPLPAGETGTVWVRSPSTGRSYRYVGAESKPDAEGWETLGDIGRVDEEGFLYLSDRDTDMIVVGGSNVYPAEIEAALSEHPSVADACVIGLPSEDLGNVPHALLNLSEPVADAALVAHLRERLAPYKVPRSFEAVDEPLRDDAGKVRRSALRQARLPTGS